MKFAKLLSNYGDIYINDAFGVSHRNHASVSAITQFFENKKYKGFLLDRELIELKKLKNNKIEPYTIIVGGSKIGSKIHMLKSFLNVADNIIIGGGMAFPFIKYLGGEIGNSIFQENELKVVKEFLDQAKNSKTKIVLPIDCLITNSIDKKTDQSYTDIKNIPEHHMGVDIGVRTIKLFSDVISKSKLIMWNGPMGISEIEDFSNGTREIAATIVEATKQGSYSLVGGGDTISDISRFGLKKEFSYISTGGGAMLEFFKNENLPGIKNLESIS
jgi:phosphoglycerate kinase